VITASAPALSISGHDPEGFLLGLITAASALDVSWRNDNEKPTQSAGQRPAVDVRSAARSRLAAGVSVNGLVTLSVPQAIADDEAWAD